MRANSSSLSDSAREGFRSSGIAEVAHRAGATTCHRFVGGDTSTHKSIGDLIRARLYREQLAAAPQTAAGEYLG